MKYFEKYIETKAEQKKKKTPKSEIIIRICWLVSRWGNTETFGKYRVTLRNLKL